MDPLLQNPAVQSAIIPFVLTLIVVLALQRISWKWAGISLIIGFLSCVYLTMGLEFTPLTSTRKIIILALLAFTLAMALDFMGLRHKWLSYGLAVVGALASTWIVWRFAERQEAFQTWIIVISSMLYCGLIIFSHDKLSTDPEHSPAALLSLAIGTSISAVLGASASLGQLAGAVASSMGVYFLFQMLKNNVALPRNVTLTASSLLAFMGISAVVYAKLPWYVLIFLLCIPLILFLPLPRNAGKVPGIMLSVVYTAPFVFLAIFITYKIAGAPPF